MSPAPDPSTAKASGFPPREGVTHEAASSRSALWELAVGYGLLQAALWSEGELRWIWAVAVALWIIGATVYHRPTLRELGLGWTGLVSSLWSLGLAAVAGAAMLLAGHWAGTLHSYGLPRTLLVLAAGYLFWTFQQQFMLQAFFFLRLEQLLGGRRAVWAAAGLFALAHFPNPVLVPATWAAGLAFCELFRRYRNLYALATAQALLGMCLAAAVPEAWHHHMRSGIGYLSWIAR